jgi:hypothetical protein
MHVGLASALIAVVVCTAGCGGSGVAPHPASPKAVTSAERKAIFNDWYDGRIDGVYPCAVVQDAIRHLPSTPPIGSTVVQDFQRYERRVC